MPLPAYLMMLAFPTLAGAAQADSLAESMGTVLADSQERRPHVQALSSEPCYRFNRKVEWRNAVDPKSEWKPWNEWTSYVSTSLIPHIEGILTPWSHQVRAESLWITGLSIADSGLGARVVMEKNDFPLDETWDKVWERRVTFPQGKPVVFDSRILERGFRVTALFEPEADRKLCRLPPLPKKRASSKKQ